MYCPPQGRSVTCNTSSSYSGKKNKMQNKVLNGVLMLRVGLRNCGYIYYYFSSVFVFQKSLLNHLKEGNAQNHTTNRSCNMIPSVQVKGHSSAGCDDHTELWLPNFFNVIIIVVHMTGGGVLHTTVHSGSQRPTLWSWFPHSTFTWVAGVQLRW